MRGRALTLKPTSHRFAIALRTLYTWCALDAVFLPGLIGRTAQVTSTCPTTGREIWLTIAPEGVVAYQPQTTVLSITVPGISCRVVAVDAGRKLTGPTSQTCSQIHFFATPEAAGEWLRARPGIAVMTPDEAYRLAVAN